MDRRNALKRIAATSAIVVFAGFTARAEGKATFWDQVMAEAKACNKKIMLLFSGLEWCGPCRRFDSEVINNPEFKEFAKSNLIFIDADRKNNGTVVISKSGKACALGDAEVSSLMNMFQNKYPVEGVPTAFILSADGKILAKNVGSGISAVKFIEMVKDAK